ncbi:MAG: TonB-dependent receptor [Porticoccaceae bacterium]|nr:TonB-dependent receptor [Porticoccaceae bacterium]
MLINGGVSVSGPMFARFFQSVPVFLAVSGATLASALEEVTVIADQVFKDTSLVSPTSSITAQQLEAISITTVEDALAHEPSLIVRKRFIGDPNSVIGMRGSNMFQTTRSMVFVDGMPLHYHLQTRYRGAPRWSLVSPGEIDNVEVIYGAFSAEYSGNAMGGVVNVNTRRPSSERVTFETGYFAQEYQQQGTDETFGGYRTYAAYENKIGNLGLFASYTKMDNEGQPQTQLFTQSGSGTAGAVAASGFVQGINEASEDGIYFADSGPESSKTDLFKAKLFYDLDGVQLRGSVAYEERTRVEDQQNNFLHDSAGDPIFDRRVDVNGEVYDTYAFGRSRLQQRSQERNSLLLGAGISAELGTDWVSDAFYSYFKILDDVEVRSGNHPLAATFADDNARYRARITEYDNTGWQIFDVKLATESWLGNDSQRLSVGAHYDDYKLNYIVDDYNSIAGLRDSDEVDGDPATGRADSGGRASTAALFVHYGYALSEQWDLSLGLRYEDWQAQDGFIGATQTPERSETGFSPKFSLAWESNDSFEVRYSLAKALRFPVIEELYVNDNKGAGAAIISDPSLEPEDGIFHNLSVLQAIDDGSLRINLFYEVIDDVIFNQRATNGTSTFLPVGEVTTSGAEFIWEQRGVFATPLDVRFNLTHIDAEITDNVFNPTFEGRQFPRSPEWRSNLMLSYKLSPQWDMGASIRYASDSFGELDNSDTAENVFGAQDSFLFVGTKLNWQLSKALRLSVGIDNLFDEEAYVFHPWPGRTYHVQAKYQLAK